MLITRKAIGSISASLVLLAGAFSVGATQIGPGQSTSASGELDPVGGTVLFTTNVAFSSASFTGTLTSSVISGDLSNSYGGLTFTYQYDINLGSPDASANITIGNLIGGFSNYLSDVSYQIPGAGVAPATISRSPTGGGRNITFDFIGGGYIFPGQISDVLVVETDASSWTFGNASIQDDHASPDVLTLIPDVPEPTNFALFTLGFLSLAGVTYQKRQNRLKNQKHMSLR